MLRDFGMTLYKILYIPEVVSVLLNEPSYPLHMNAQFLSELLDKFPDINKAKPSEVGWSGKKPIDSPWIEMALAAHFLRFVEQAAPLMTVM